MGTLKGGYHLKDGTRVPSVTTILGKFKDPGPLMYWAWSEGKEGRDFRQTRDAAANAGTMAHDAVEAWIKGDNYAFTGDPEVCKRAQSAFGAFLEWADQTQLKVTHTELPLVSEKYGFGGTFDALFIRGKRSMGDWKTSSGIYPEYGDQVAAYGILWEENFPDEPIEGGFHLLRFDKMFGDFHHHWWGELDDSRESFLALLTAYKARERSKGRFK